MISSIANVRRFYENLWIKKTNKKNVFWYSHIDLGYGANFISSNKSNDYKSLKGFHTRDYKVGYPPSKYRQALLNKKRNRAGWTKLFDWIWYPRINGDTQREMWELSKIKWNHEVDFLSM